MTSGSETSIRIAVFGSKADAWNVGALLAKQKPPSMAITLVITPDQPEIAAAQSIAAAHPFLRALGLSQDDLVSDCEGTLGLAEELVGWQGEGSSIFSAPSGSLPLIDGVALHHILLRAAMTYEEPSRLGHLYRPFRFAARAAEQGSFALPGDDPASPLRLLGPVVQHDRHLFADLLAQRAGQDGVDVRSGVPVSAELDGETGAVNSVALDNGAVIEGELFIDLSGRVAGLAGSKIELGPVDLLAPFDRMITGTSAPESGQSQSRARAMAGALLVETPLVDSRDIAMLYCSDQLSDDQASNWVGFGPEPEEFRAYVEPIPWQANVVRMGQAAGQLGPVSSADSLALIEQALRLVEFLPAGQSMVSEAAAFNRAVGQVMQEIRDFVVLPVALNSRNDEPWAGLRDACVPDSLALIIDQFLSRGRFVGTEHQVFDDQRWIELMIAMGVVPERYDLRADAFDMRQLAPVLQRIARDFDAHLKSIEG